ncbi:hypothetical protein [Bacterioplanoides sp.]|uniref:hypothetical protein n=1 Tax=Bacterioplanoides sp. TaxID=2066072 RepID=UPI003B009274
MGRERLIADMKALLAEVEQAKADEGNDYALGYLQGGIKSLTRDVAAGEYDD